MTTFAIFMEDKAIFSSPHSRAVCEQNIVNVLKMLTVT